MTQRITSRAHLDPLVNCPRFLSTFELFLNLLLQHQSSVRHTDGKRFLPTCSVSSPSRSGEPSKREEEPGRACVLRVQPPSRARLRDPVDCSPPGSSVHGISQARTLEWVAIPSPGDLPDLGIKPASRALAGGFFTTSECPWSLDGVSPLPRTGRLTQSGALRSSLAPHCLTGLLAAP